jgi:hypothetical protein
MAQDMAASASDSDCEVMASVDSHADGERLIIAELCRDDAWLSITEGAAVTVAEFR